MWVIWVDVGAAVIGLTALCFVALGLYRKVKHVKATIAVASNTFNELTHTLEQLGSTNPGTRR